MKTIQDLKILSNTNIKDKYYKLTINAPQIAKTALPGQFVNIKVCDGYEPLLRRPFCIHQVKDANIEILYEVVGIGTEILSHKKPGEYLDVLGPLGSGFELDGKTEELKNGRTILVAGGMGVAPLIFLAEKLAKSKIKNQKSKILVLIGAKTKNHILCEKEFRQFGCDVNISTDDGSKGFKGKATDLLKKQLSTMDYRPSTIYACGPRPMLKEVAKISNRFKIKAYGSLEEHMACGIGACLGCVVKTKSGYQTVCKDGPVFDMADIIY